MEKYEADAINDAYCRQLAVIYERLFAEVINDMPQTIEAALGRSRRGVIAAKRTRLLLISMLEAKDG